MYRGGGGPHLPLQPLNHSTEDPLCLRQLGAASCPENCQREVERRSTPMKRPSRNPEVYQREAWGVRSDPRHVASSRNTVDCWLCSLSPVHSGPVSKPPAWLHSAVTVKTIITLLPSCLLSGLTAAHPRPSNQSSEVLRKLRKLFQT